MKTVARYDEMRITDHVGYVSYEAFQFGNK